MGSPPEPAAGSAAARAHLERCLEQDCDIDPMILRMRLLRQLGSLPQADCLEQELQPLF
jgi:hypothetical protein